MIGIHSPEFDYEKKLEPVKNAVDRYKLTYPIMMDNDYAYWKRLGNRYWPSFYLVDKQGQIVWRVFGQTEMNSSDAQDVENRVIKLLNAS